MQTISDPNKTSNNQEQTNIKQSRLQATTINNKQPTTIINKQPTEIDNKQPTTSTINNKQPITISQPSTENNNKQQQ